MPFPSSTATGALITGGDGADAGAAAPTVARGEGSGEACFAEAGLPPGVFNVVLGLGPSAGRMLAEHPDIDKLVLTGGTEAGRIAGSAAARVFAVGSWFEGFCQPGLEALACGTSLVTTDNGGCREYAVHEETTLQPWLRAEIAHYIKQYRFIPAFEDGAPVADRLLLERGGLELRADGRQGRRGLRRRVSRARLR